MSSLSLPPAVAGDGASPPWTPGSGETPPVVVLEVGGIKRNETFKVGINGVNREADFANQDVDGERWKKFNIELKPWRTTGDAIILCGQHHKSHQWRNNLSMNLNKAPPPAMPIRPPSAFSMVKISSVKST